MLRPMFVSVLAVDSSTNSPIVILKEVDGERTLPIWIGLLEANAIASEMEGIKFARPMTHDLLKNIMALTRLGTRAIGMCSMAPAEALETEGLGRAERSWGMTTPSTPAQYAVLMTAPRLWGS